MNDMSEVNVYQLSLRADVRGLKRLLSEEDL